MVASNPKADMANDRAANRLVLGVTSESLLNKSMYMTNVARNAICGTSSNNVVAIIAAVLTVRMVCRPCMLPADDAAAGEGLLRCARACIAKLVHCTIHTIVATTLHARHADFRAA